MVGLLWNHGTERGREYPKCRDRIFSLAKPEEGHCISIACAWGDKEASKERAIQK